MLVTARKPSRRPAKRRTPRATYFALRYTNAGRLLDEAREELARDVRLDAGASS